MNRGRFPQIVCMEQTSSKQTALNERQFFQFKEVPHPMKII